MRRWDPAAGWKRPILRGHTAEGNAVVFSPDGRWLVSGGSDLAVKLGEAAPEREPSEMLDVQPAVGHRQG